MVIVGWDFSGSYDSPLFVGAPPDGHDFGIARDPEKFSTIFEEYSDMRFIGIDEFIGYLHANNFGKLTKGQKLRIELVVQYDDHYCQHFNEHTSEWTLHLSDRLREKLAGKKTIDIVSDGKLIKHVIDPSKYFTETIKIEVPKGIGKHTITYKQQE